MADYASYSVYVEQALRSRWLGATAFVGLLVAVLPWWMTFMFFTEMLHADYPNPYGPGLVGVIVTPAEFWLKTIAFVLLAVLNILMLNARLRAKAQSG